MKKSQTGIPELVKATGNVTTVDALAVNAEAESFSKKKREDSSYNTSLPSCVKEEVGNVHTATGHKLQLITSNQSTNNTLFMYIYSTIIHITYYKNIIKSLYTFTQWTIKQEHTCRQLPLLFTFTLNSGNTWSFYLSKVF